MQFSFQIDGVMAIQTCFWLCPALYFGQSLLRNYISCRKLAGCWINEQEAGTRGKFERSPEERMLEALPCQPKPLTVFMKTKFADLR